VNSSVLSVPRDEEEGSTRNSLLGLTVTHTPGRVFKQMALLMNMNPLTRPVFHH